MIVDHLDVLTARMGGGAGTSIRNLGLAGKRVECGTAPHSPEDTAEHQHRIWSVTDRPAA